jgi:hypothetical protein
MGTRQLSLCIFLTTLSLVASGQERMTYSALARELAGPGESLEYVGVKFENDLERNLNNPQDLTKPDLFNRYLRSLLKRDSAGRYVVDKDVLFENCTFDNDFILKGLAFGGSFSMANPTFTINQSLFPFLVLDSCLISKGLAISSQNAFQRIQISNSVIKEMFILDANNIREVAVRSTKIILDEPGHLRPFSVYVGSEVSLFSFDNSEVNHTGENQMLGGFIVASVNFRIRESTFYSANRDAALPVFASNADLRSIFLINNSFDVHVMLYPPVDVDIKLMDNSFKRNLGWEYTGLAPSSVIDWETIPVSRTGQYFNVDGASFPDSLFFNGRNDEQLDDRRRVMQLIKMFKGMYDLYKTGGDIESANAAYIVIRDLETRYLQRVQQKNPSYETFLKIKLNQLMKVYTLYGTSPARAIIVSGWVILGFAVFYFFFPSTWDVTSKSRLVSNFRDFAQKNDKGYVKPFFVMLGGFLISILNAITLSLNSFVTLGFGEIPTRGAARYITIIQGFIGWFLLSIFTVAVINQALF